MPQCQLRPEGNIDWWTVDFTKPVFSFLQTGQQLPLLNHCEIHCRQNLCRHTIISTGSITLCKQIGHSVCC